VTPLQRAGTVCFVAPVQGKVTGAVFVGDGNMILDPRQASERASLKLLTKEDEFSENFNHLVLRFTDGTYEELKKSGGAASGGCDGGLLHDSQNAMRHDRMLKYNLDGRILEDVLRSDPGGLFVAFIHGKRYNGKELLFVDPHGAPNVAPEEVELMTYDENKLGLWTSFHLEDEETKGTALHQGIARIEHQKLDTTIEKNANFQGKAYLGSSARRHQSDSVQLVSEPPGAKRYCRRRPAAGFHSGGQERRRRFSRDPSQGSRQRRQTYHHHGVRRQGGSG